MARTWYAYDGVGDPFIAGSYIRASVKPGCINGANLCAIYAFNGDINPSAPLSANLTNYISNALITLVAQPQDTGRFKKYVYMKDLG